MMNHPFQTGTFITARHVPEQHSRDELDVSYGVFAEPSTEQNGYNPDLVGACSYKHSGIVIAVDDNWVLIVWSHGPIGWTRLRLIEEIASRQTCPMCTFNANDIQ